VILAVLSVQGALCRQHKNLCPVWIRRQPSPRRGTGNQALERNTAKSNVQSAATCTSHIHTRPSIIMGCS